MESLENVLSAASSHLLRAKIAYLEGDSLKSVQHAMIAGDIASYAIFNKVGGVERIISSAENRIRELETVLRASKRQALKSAAARS